MIDHSVSPTAQQLVPLKFDRCYCCGRFMSIERSYPPLEEDRCEECEMSERPSRLYRTGRRADYFAALGARS